MTDSAHPSFRALADLADGVGSGPRDRHAAAHVAGGCADCARQVEELRALTGVLAAGPLPAPPAPSLRAARRLFAGARRRAAVEALAGWVAHLVLDQRAAMAPALRAAQGEQRRLLFNVGPFELYCEVEPDGGSATLRGQFLTGDAGAEPITGTVALEREGRGAARSAHGPLDDDLAFVFGGVTPGSYVLTGEIAGRPFCVPPFVVD